MNSNLLENLYRQCITHGFGPLNQEAVTLADTAGFTLGREENTTLCLVQVTDLDRLNKQISLFLRDQEMERAAALAGMYSSVWVVFLWISGDSSEASVPEGLYQPEGYYGQSPYAIYWHINPNTSEIFVLHHQPDDVMGLKAVIRAVLDMGATGNLDVAKNLDALDNLDVSDVAKAFRSTSTDLKSELKTLESEIEALQAEIKGIKSEMRDLESELALDSLDSLNTLGSLENSGNSEKNPYVKVRIPLCTIILIATNVLVMILMYQQGFAQMPDLVAAQFGAIIPSLVWEGEYYRLLTAMFVHFGWSHLFFNMVGMLIFGTRVERYYGKVPFLAVYFISGLTASVASLLFTRGFSAGASGAVYGLLGAAFVYTRFTKRSMDIINNQVVLIYILIGLILGFAMPNIDYFGHIGGLIAGLIIGGITSYISYERPIR